jgi:hypothetical protein
MNSMQYGSFRAGLSAKPVLFNKERLIETHPPTAQTGFLFVRRRLGFGKKAASNN